eukprot:3010232-Prymnesium_polylepis.4
MHAFDEASTAQATRLASGVIRDKLTAVAHSEPVFCHARPKMTVAVTPRVAATSAVRERRDMVQLGDVVIGVHAIPWLSEGDVGVVGHDRHARAAGCKPVQTGVELVQGGGPRTGWRSAVLRVLRNPRFTILH